MADVFLVPPDVSALIVKKFTNGEISRAQMRQLLDEVIAFILIKRAIANG